MRAQDRDGGLGAVELGRDLIRAARVAAARQ
jgi:hypothetical protein